MDPAAWLPGFDGHAGLIGLVVSAFLAATLLPGGSEAVLAAFIAVEPGSWREALALATVGNTAGGMSTYLLGRLFPERELPERLETVKRYGPVTLLFAWMPFFGDALCVAAGWLRLNWIACALWMGLGKLGRYAVVYYALLLGLG